MAKIKFNVTGYNATIVYYSTNYYNTPRAMGKLIIAGTDDFWKDLFKDEFYQAKQDAVISKATLFAEVRDSFENIVIRHSIEHRTDLGISGWYSIKTTSTSETHSYLEENAILNADRYYINTFQANITQRGIYKINYGISMVKATGNIAVTYNRLPLKKWTVTDVINRCLDLIEPLTYGQKPRFRLRGQNYDNETGNPTTKVAGSQAEKYDQILAPEFSFTKMTLREMLKEIGGFIHAEPRLSERKVDENGEKYWEVYYTEYGGQEYSQIKKKHSYFLATAKTGVNDYCTALDSSAENLVSQLDWAQGVTVEPFNGGSKSLRTEQTTARLAEDDTTYIFTQYPIYSIGHKRQVICRYIPELGSGYWDITPYVFEKADYDGTLDSYTEAYPFSRSYALWYKQGSPNIYGLFFKVPHSVSPTLSQYAIKNILEAVTGQSLKLEGQDYMKLAFSVSYLPIFGTRVKTHKPTVRKGLPRTLAYNQGANVVETRFYGENLKGVAARLGNVERTYTYHLPFIGQVPKAGQLFDDEYYISAVYTEVLPLYIKCTVGLSKDFNRLSEYVGISAEKRMWEVSEKQSIDRQSVYTEYLMLSGEDSEREEGAAFGGNVTPYLFNTAEGYPVNLASVKTYDKQGNRLNGSYDIVLPVISTALGNSLLLNYRMDDSYSAGQKSEYVAEEDNNADVSGYWGAYVPYADYYGRFYYLDTDFYINSPSVSSEEGKNLPQGANLNGQKVISIAKQKYRKDSREVPNNCYELCAVTDDESIVIGSGLFKNSMLVNTSPLPLKVYAFKKRINTVDSRLALEDAEEIGVPVLDTLNDKITLPAATDSGYKAWAIATERGVTEIDVEDEDGVQTKQRIITGGELIFGQNGDYPRGQSFYLRVKRKVN